jgi:hypothetical protein
MRWDDCPHRAGPGVCLPAEILVAANANAVTGGDCLHTRRTP